MRDAIEMFEFAEHGRAWTAYVITVIRRTRRLLRMRARPLPHPVRSASADGGACKA